MFPDFTFHCSKCENTSFRSSHPINSLNDIHGAICSRCYKPVTTRDITEHKIKHIKLILNEKILNSLSPG
jgi:hypothetical protein